MGWYSMHTHRGEKIEVTHLHLIRIFNESFDDQVLILLSPANEVGTIQE